MTELETRTYEPFDYLEPDQLLEANQSTLSQERIDDYFEGKRNGKNTLVLGCADSRVGPSILDSNRVTAIRSIGGAYEPIRFQFAIEHAGIGRIMILSHYDKDLSEAVGSFLGCGGLDAKDQLSNGHLDPSASFGKYVSNNLDSKHPIVQAYKMKDKVSQTFTTPDKFRPMMLGLVDHRTGLIVPFWDSNRDDRGIYHTHSRIQTGRLNPFELVPGSFPSLGLDEINEGFSAMLISNREWVNNIANNDPKFKDRQSKQDPFSVVVTTSIIPLRNRYAGLFDKPNQAFVLAVPILKKRSGGVVFDSKSVLNQLDYPIEAAVRADPNLPFFSTRTVVFETGYIKQSNTLAEQFASSRLGKKWIDEKNGRIIIMSTEHGETKESQYFKP